MMARSFTSMRVGFNLMKRVCDDVDKNAQQFARITIVWINLFSLLQFRDSRILNILFNDCCQVYHV